MTRYLETLQPILDPNSLDHTRQLISTFMAPDGVGPQLQNLLIQRSMVYDNWVSQEHAEHVTKFYDDWEGRTRVYCKKP